MDFLNSEDKVKVIGESLGSKQYNLEESGESRAGKCKTGTENKLPAEAVKDSPYKYYMEKVADAKSIDEINDILEYAVKCSLPEVALKCYLARGFMYVNKGNDIKAISDFNEALQLAYKKKIDEDLVTIWNNISSCYMRLMDYKNAAVYLSKAFEVCRLQESSELRNIVIYNLVLCYCEMGKYEKAIEIIDECVNLEHDMGTDELCRVILLTKGGALIECKRYEEAEALFTRMLRNFEGDNKNKAFCLHNLGTIYNKLGKYEEAERRYIEAIEMREAFDISKASTTMIELGEMYISIGRKEEGVKKLKKGIEYANNYKRYKDIIRGSRILEQLYKDCNELESLEMLYIKLLMMLDKNKKMVDYRNEILNKMGQLYIERNHLDKLKNKFEEI